MKKILAIGMHILLCHFASGQSATTMTSVHGDTLYLDSLVGKKTLVVILPMQQDSAVLNQLIRFCNRFGNMRVIGLVTAATTIYADAESAGAFISLGSTTANGNTRREVVLRALSEKNKNSRQDETGLVGSKYFLSAGGRIYAQLGAEVSLDSRIVENIVRTKVPGEN